MKIIDERRKETTYGDLEFGAVFEVDGSICMKTDIPHPVLLSNFLSVDLRTGSQYVISSGIKVTPVNTNLILV